MIQRARHAVRVLALLAGVWGPLATAAESFDDSAVKHIAYPDWFEDTPFNDLEETLRHGVADGKQGLMVLLTTEGCSYCDAFVRKSLSRPDIAARVQRDFAAVGLEIFDDAEMTDPRGTTLPVKAFAEREKAAFAPTLLFYGPDGERLLRSVGYQSPERFAAILAYVSEGHYREQPLRAYLARHPPTSTSAGAGTPPVARKDPPFSLPPYAFDRSRVPADRPLLIVFAQRDCAACDVLYEDVLRAADIRALLDRFAIAHVDAADNVTPVVAPDGRRTTPAGLYAEAEFTQTPALLFFDEHGNEVLKTDTLVLRQRMHNALSYVLERGYARGMTYQRFARTKAAERGTTDPR